MENKLAIVVGITGMDGESLTHFLLSKNYKVVGTYRKNTLLNTDILLKSYHNNPNLVLEHCEITDFNSVRILLQKYEKIDEVYLLAAQSHVGNSFESPESTVITNGMSSFNFLENLRLYYNETKLYYAATSELLGGDPKNCPFDENSPFECRSPYAIGKELGTRWVKYYQQTYGMFACYGILFNHSNNSRHESFFIKRVTKAAARIEAGKQKELVLGNIDFYRDEHWSDFGVEMMWKMLQQDEPETYLICKGECYHGEEFLNNAFGYFNLDWKHFVTIDKSRFRPNEVVKLVGNPQKAIEKLGWNPNRMSFKKHISLMCEYDYNIELGNTPTRTDVFKINKEDLD